MKNAITEAKLKTNLITWLQQNRFIWLLPLLEYSFTEAEMLVRDAYQQAGLSAEDATTFPFDQLLVVALAPGVVSYWAELAIDWLVHGYPLTKELADTVDEVIAAKRITQRARHRAGKLVRSWRISMSIGSETT